MKNWIFSIALLAIISVANPVLAGSNGLITKEDLLAELDNPQLVILDVRTGRDWKSSEFKIKGAVRANPFKLDDWIGQHSKNRRYVTYCA